MVNKVATSVKTDIKVDRNTMTWTLKDTRLSVNGIELDAGGTMKRDTVAKTVDVDIKYSLLHPP